VTRDELTVTGERDVRLSQRALELAALGIGQVSPNPLVGCVITDASGEVAGEGTYIYENVTHAEVIALEKAGERAKSGTAYVSLEPHSHFNKTPPCTEALIDAGIVRVVCPIEDPNPKVSGKGFERLKEAGVEVVTGILANEAAKQNEKFICWHKKGRPFVHLKLAASLDGRIAFGASVSSALSGEAARGRVQELRHEHDAILIGGNTAAVDDPNLTDRSGLKRRRPLVRVVLDDRLMISEGSKLVTSTDAAPTIVFTSSTDAAKIGRLRDQGVEVIDVGASTRDLAAVLEELKRRDLQSILVEGGSLVAGAFATSGLVDKVTFIYAPLVIGGGDAPVAIGGSGDSVGLKLRDVTTAALDQDIEITGYPV
jgi:diaminohydroxyphosphoribosylaminopyrimidine deaminase/5-amino-6-(5-phosphoribosylamino)uracil reductase